MSEFETKVLEALAELKAGQNELNKKIDGVENKLDWAVAELKLDGRTTRMLISEFYTPNNETAKLTAKISELEKRINI